MLHFPCQACPIPAANHIPPHPSLLSSPSPPAVSVLDAFTPLSFGLRASFPRSPARSCARFRSPTVSSRVLAFLFAPPFYLCPIGLPSPYGCTSISSPSSIVLCLSRRILLGTGPGAHSRPSLPSLVTVLFVNLATFPTICSFPRSPPNPQSPSLKKRIIPLRPTGPNSVQAQVIWPPAQDTTAQDMQSPHPRLAAPVLPPELPACTRSALQFPYLPLPLPSRSSYPCSHPHPFAQLIQPSNPHINPIRAIRALGLFELLGICRPRSPAGLSLVNTNTNIPFPAFFSDLDRPRPCSLTH
ncbi:hypothetical protein BOTBODRAFT_586907 [Botryobasidium botryosum FD-172 SS1]|uniref:Uncharacterized protein n=1 Tax=Botryobasidium botryosum (strain FD-172 SS1) TaxID=930990 RepID=A0A067M905_BOTB1|nr:hypothetical protein BOTBODRAFT_586907 [Botryobasidium botryosum FD-172 SS1]